MSLLNKLMLYHCIKYEKQNLKCIFSSPLNCYRIISSFLNKILLNIKMFSIITYSIDK